MRRRDALAACAALSWAIPLGAAPSTKPSLEVSPPSSARECYPPDTVADRGLVSPATNSSPAAAEVAGLIDRFITAAASGDGNALAEVADSDWLKQPATQTCIAAIASIEPQCRRLPLYLLESGEVRAEWVCGTRTAYDVFFSVRNNKVVDLWSVDATDPVEVARLSRPDRNILYALMVDDEAGSPGKVLTLPEERPAGTPSPMVAAENRQAAARAIAQLVAFSSSEDSGLSDAVIYAIGGGDMRLSRKVLDENAAAEMVEGCRAWHPEDLGTSPGSGRDYVLVRLFCINPVAGRTRIHAVVGVADGKIRSLFLNVGRLIEVWKRAPGSGS